MENARPLQHHNSVSAAAAAAAAPGISSAERNSKMPPGAPRRKRLSDITNLATDGRAAAARSFAGGGKENADSTASAAVFNKDAYAQLLKENNALMRALAERNNLIELSGAEIQKLRLAMQKLTLQNQQLAQANSQMLAERNQDKERLKVFQHEIACVQAVLKANNSELEEYKNRIKEASEASLHSEDETVEPIKLDHVIQNPPLSADKKKASNTNRKRQCSNVSNHQVGAKVKEESTRKSSRRRSTSSKHDLCEPSENLLEVVGVSVPSPASDDHMSRDSSNQVDPSAPSVSSVSAYPVREEEEQEDPPIPANNKKASSNNRKRALSLGSVVSVHELGGKEKDDCRRKSSRRISTVLKHDPCGGPNENLFDTENVKFPVHSLTSDDPMSRDSSSQVMPSAPPVSKEKDESTRMRSNRSSTGLKPYLCEPNENLSEVEEAVPSLVHDDPMRADTSSQVDPSVPPVSNLSTYPVKEEHGLIGTPQVQDQEVRRSFARPIRRAAVKVNSYKEVPLNVKMRRV